MSDIINELHCGIVSFCGDGKTVSELNKEFSLSDDIIKQIIKRYKRCGYIEYSEDRNTKFILTDDGREAIKEFMIGVSDKTHILNILKAFKNINYHDSIQNRYHIFRLLNSDDRERIRDKLLEGELINLGQGKFEIKLTAKGILSKDNDFNSDGEYIDSEILLRNEIHKQSQITAQSSRTTAAATKMIAYATLVGVIVSIVALFLKQCQKEIKPIQQIIIDKKPKEFLNQNYHDSTHYIFSKNDSTQLNKDSNTIK